MKCVIEIDDKTKAGKSLLGLVQTMSKENKGIIFLEEESDTVSFDIFEKQLNDAVNKRLTKKENKNESAYKKIRTK